MGLVDVDIRNVSVNKKFDTKRDNAVHHAMEISTTKDEIECAFSTSKEVAGYNEWIYDTGARTHITLRLC
jgi:hypothetical protein